MSTAASSLSRLHSPFLHNSQLKLSSFPPSSLSYKFARNHRPCIRADLDTNTVVTIAVGVASVAIGIGIPIFYESQIDSAAKRENTQPCFPCNGSGAPNCEHQNYPSKNESNKNSNLALREAVNQNQSRVGLEKEVLRAGTGRKPVPSQNVTVHCTGFGKNGDLSQKFWSTKDAGQKPFTFKIGQGQVIKGWDEGVLGMQLGEVARLRCTPDYAYGADGFSSWELCRFCTGSGNVSVELGGGEKEVSRCINCDGAGSLTCTTCQGSGIQPRYLDRREFKDDD